MAEWWTYSISDFLLFSPRTYYRLFELYNADLWPAQILAILLGTALLFATMWKLELASKNASFKLKALRRRLEADALERPAGETREPVAT